MPKVRIVADYDSSGYQVFGDSQSSELPVSAELSDRLARWNDRFERCDPTDYEDVCGNSFDFVAFAAEGLEIARAVKRALPGWTVLYWDEALDWFHAREPRSYNPARSEYEITLEEALKGSRAQERTDFDYREMREAKPIGSDSGRA